MEQRQSDQTNEPHVAPSAGAQPTDPSTEIPAQTEPTPANRPDQNERRNQRSNDRQNVPRGDAQRGDATRTDAQRGDRGNQARDNRQPGNGQSTQASTETAARKPERDNRKNGGQRPESRPERGNRNDGPRNDGPRNDGQRSDWENRPEAGQPDTPSTDAGNRDERLTIGISLGDYNGIGPEVILKALQYNRLQKLCTPVIYGSMRVLNRYRSLLNMKDWNLNGAPTIGQISHKLTNVITCWPDQNQEIQPGQVTPEAGQAALACLQRAVDDLKAGKLDALVTAPINKYNIQSDEFKFPGHTEYLAEHFGVTDNLMFLVSERLRVGVVTGHVPLGRVRQNVTRERIAQKLTLMMQSLKQDFGLEKPRIAVLGLNPHAGEEGLLGNEEQEIITPLLNEWRNKGHLVFGPFAADGFFGTRGYRNFDAVLAMYHDQGLIPFKTIAFEEGVNFTAGMPVVRTSPDHGTAYDIAGKDLADETSMLQAIYAAIDVARQRKEYLELEANALH